MTKDEAREIDSRETKRGKSSGLPIDTARGGVVDEPSLVDALRSGKLAGAGLDVFADEPPPTDSPLFDIDSVILTPHMACYSEVSMDEMHEMAIAHVVDVLGKEKR
jgi:D-3-phosphoglycerate dehydrogenase